MSDLPRPGEVLPDEDEIDPGVIDDGEPLDPAAPELDDDGNPIAPAELDENGDPVEPDPQPQPRQNAQQRRDDRARGRLRDVTAERDEFARRLAAVEARQQAPAPVQQVDPAAAQREEQTFWASLEQMLPHEQVRAVAERERQRYQQQSAAIAIGSFDQFDRYEFAQLQATNRWAERLAPRVEAVLQERRRNGDYSMGRKAIFTYLYGEEMLKPRPAQAQRQRQQAAARVAGQTVSPAAARGDIAARAGGGRNQDAADEAYLRRVTTADI